MCDLYINRHTSKVRGPLKSHFHNDYYEIYYLKRGSVRYIISDKIYTMSKNEVALIPRGVIHNTAYDGIDTERFLINFSESFDIDKKLLYAFEKSVISLSEKESFEFESIYKKIEKEAALNDEFSKDLISQYISELLISFLRKDTDLDTAVLDGYEKTIQGAVEYINENYANELSLDTLSKKFSLSRSFFSRKFKEVTGFGLSEYITLVRVKAAEKLLLTKDISITDVAYKSGFNDSSYFAQTFKKVIGVTPLKYAKNK